MESNINYRLTLITICSLYLVGCGSNNSGNTKQNFNNDKYTQQLEDLKDLDIVIEHFPLEGKPLNISVGIENNTDRNILLLHDYAASPCRFSVIEDGKKLAKEVIINYVEGGTILQPEASFYRNVDISFCYRVTKGTHKYEITYESSNTLEFETTLQKDWKPE